LGEPQVPRASTTELRIPGMAAAADYPALRDGFGRRRRGALWANLMRDAVAVARTRGLRCAGLYVAHHWLGRGTERIFHAAPWCRKAGVFFLAGRIEAGFQYKPSGRERGETGRVDRSDWSRKGHCLVPLVRANDRAAIRDLFGLSAYSRRPKFDPAGERLSDFDLADTGKSSTQSDPGKAGKSVL